MCYSLSNYRPQSFLDILKHDQSLPIEIVKSVVLKKLIQIDRSVGLNCEQLRAECSRYLRIEAIANHGESHMLTQFLAML